MILNPPHAARLAIDLQRPFADSRRTHRIDAAGLNERHARRPAIEAPKEQRAPADSFETEFWIRRAGGDFVRLGVASIDFAVVEEDYVRIVAGEKSYLLRESIRGLLARLDPEQFIQVHRSALARTSAIAEIGRVRFGGAEVVLKGGQHLPLGRIHGKAVRRLIRRGA